MTYFKVIPRLSNKIEYSLYNAGKIKIKQEIATIQTTFRNLFKAAELLIASLNTIG